MPKYENTELLVICIYFIFLKENQAGQSVYTEYVEETLAPIDQSGPLPDFAFDAVSNKNDELQAQLLEHFNKDGEQVYECTQWLILLYAIEVVNEEWTKSEKLIENRECTQLNYSLLWTARYSMLYSDLLSSNIVHLQDQSLTCYSEFIK